MVQSDNIAKSNYREIENRYGKAFTRMMFGDWTTFKRDKLSVSDAIKGINEAHEMSSRYESTIVGN